MHATAGIVNRGQLCCEGLISSLCHEFWNSIYPSVYALLNGASLDYGEQRATQFDAKCSNGGRVCIHGELMEENRTE